MSSLATSTNFTLTNWTNLTGTGVEEFPFIIVMSTVVVISLGILICCINASMVHTFNKHQIFKFNPRYILFIHLVLNDMIQVTASISLYIFAHTFYTIYVSVCILLLLPAILTNTNTPLNLACMAAECYISVCIPLRHENICTVKKIYIVIFLMWAISLLAVLPDVFTLFITEELDFLKRRLFCDRDTVFRNSYGKNKRDASHIFFLVVVSLTLLYTYFKIMFAAKAINSDARKARNTILLHGFQTLLCIMVYVQPLVKQLLKDLFPQKYLITQNITFVIIQVFPRFLSPVVYGLRDKVFRLYYRKNFICFQVKAVRVQS